MRPVRRAEGVVHVNVRDLRELRGKRGALPREDFLRLGGVLRQVEAVEAALAERYGVAAEVYSATSFQLLRRDALLAERWNLRNPGAAARVPYVASLLGAEGGPIVAATDWIRALPDMVREWLPADYVTLGTDGFGRSDTRESLRAFFEVDAAHIAAATLARLARSGTIPAKTAIEAAKALGVDPKRDAPFA